ncbi:MAG: type VI secretion system tip protein VgrG [Methylobacteriaceae bacterium]|nr:type VI secretion system tip protein VgrG [Methylobacteriaceae bacterium]
MAGKIKQDRRVAELSTPLGKDKLALARFDASEGLSELFEFRIEAVSEDANISFDSVLGQDCTVTFRGDNATDRQFTGVLVEAQWIGELQNYYAYRLTLRPWLWLLTRCSDCRIFHNKKAIDIILEVFRDRGFSDFRVSAGSMPTLEYCVQYRETDFAFVSRLMEQHGLYYFFKHEGGKAILNICDSKSAHSPVPGVETLEHIPQSTQRRKVQHVYSWTSERRFRTGKYELKDYNYLTPGADMQSPANGSPGNSRAGLQIYDYPGKFKNKGEGETYAKVLLQADIARDRRRYGEGDAINLFPGGLTRLARHPASGENKEYLVVRATHAFVSQSYRSSSARGAEGYYGAYEFQDSEVPFRAPIVTPKPIVFGPQTALVVGQTGEEIDVDEHGRILVRFYWDRKRDQSCRVRVAQTWAANRWGSQVIPRIDQEVVVEFLEGDPDRPMVTGCVYNGDNRVPYALPDNKTMTGIKSDSSKGHNGYNEFVFEDKKMNEKIRMHGEKDHEVKIRNSETWNIGEIFPTPKGQPSRETTLVKGDDKLTVQTGDQNITIAQEQNLKIGLNRTTQISVKDDLTVGAQQTLTVGASKSDTIGASRSATVGASDSLTVGGALTISAGGAITISAGATLTLTAGGATINLSPAGVTIMGATINCVGATNIPLLTAAGTINGHP